MNLETEISKLKKKKQTKGKHCPRCDSQRILEAQQRSDGTIVFQPQERLPACTCKKTKQDKIVDFQVITTKSGGVQSTETYRQVPSRRMLDNKDWQITLHPGQSQAWESKKRIVLVLAG